MRRTTRVNRIAVTLLGLLLLPNAHAAGADVVVVVSAKSPVGALSKDQAVDIFMSKTSRFPDGSPVLPIDQIEGAPARDEFYLRFAGKTPAQLKAHWSKIIFTGRGQPPREVSGSAEMKKLIVSTPGAIGYMEQSMVDDSVKVLLAQ